MGCGAAKATAATAPEDQPGKPVAKPVAFDIPMDEEQSIIKKHPPKRLQLLEEQSQNNALSTKDLEEKQSKAEERRQEVLQERVANAQKFQQRLGQLSPRTEEEGALPNGVENGEDS